MALLYFCYAMLCLCYVCYDVAMFCYAFAIIVLCLLCFLLCNAMSCYDFAMFRKAGGQRRWQIPSLKRVYEADKKQLDRQFDFSDFSVLQEVFDDAEIFTDGDFDVSEGLGFGLALGPTPGQARHRDAVALVRVVKGNFVLHHDPLAVIHPAAA